MEDDEAVFTLGTAAWETPMTLASATFHNHGDEMN